MAFYGNPMALHGKMHPLFEAESFYELCEYINYSEQKHYPEEHYFAEMVEQLERHIYVLKDNSQFPRKYRERKKEEFLEYIKCNADYLHDLIRLPNLFSPELNLFRDEYKYFGQDENRTVIELVNRLEIRVNEAQLMKERNKLRTRIVKNRESLFVYKNSLFQKHPTLEVLRFEISYSCCESIELSIRQFSSLRNELFYHLNKILLKDALAGYIWKLQPQLRNSEFSCHIILFVKVLDTLDVAHRDRIEETFEVIEKKWLELSGEHGGFWNVASYLKYRSQGVGLIHATNKSKQAELIRAMQYIVNPDYFLRLQLPKGIRAYGRGEVL